MISLIAFCLLVPAQVSSNDELADKLKKTYAEAAKWLAEQQHPSGAWTMGPPGRKEPSAAYTALIVSGLAGAPAEIRRTHAAVVARGIAYLLSARNLDGSFGEGPGRTYMKTYATALSLRALASVERTDRIEDALRGAQAYLKRNQMKEGLHAGGQGYGDEGLKRDPETGEFKRKISRITNLSATAEAAEAMNASGFSLSDEYWQLTAAYVRKCQNSSEVNRDPALREAWKKKGFSVGEGGDLVYTPEPDLSLHRAGSVQIGDRRSFAGTGTMTYDGIKTYIYAGLAKDSPEVKAAVGWIRRNYSIESHPGFPYDARKRHHLRGLYYYYLTLTRALDAYGETPFVTADGRAHDWSRELAARLLKTVRQSRMWKNDNPAWYEGDPVLVTAYVMNACDILFRHLGRE